MTSNKNTRKENNRSNREDDNNNSTTLSKLPLEVLSSHLKAANYARLRSVSKEMKKRVKINLTEYKSKEDITKEIKEKENAVLKKIREAFDTVREPDIVTYTAEVPTRLTRRRVFDHETSNVSKEKYTLVKKLKTDLKPSKSPLLANAMKDVMASKWLTPQILIEFLTHIDIIIESIPDAISDDLATDFLIWLTPLNNRHHWSVWTEAADIMSHKTDRVPYLKDDRRYVATLLEIVIWKCLIRSASSDVSSQLQACLDWIAVSLMLTLNTDEDDLAQSLIKRIAFAPYLADVELSKSIAFAKPKPTLDQKILLKKATSYIQYIVDTGIKQWVGKNRNRTPSEIQKRRLEIQSSAHYAILLLKKHIDVLKKYGNNPDAHKNADTTVNQYRSILMGSNLKIYPTYKSINFHGQFANTIKHH